jgi:hypothetical protein
MGSWGECLGGLADFSCALWRAVRSGSSRILAIRRARRLEGYLPSPSSLSNIQGTPQVMTLARTSIQDQAYRAGGSRPKTRWPAFIRSEDSCSELASVPVGQHAIKKCRSPRCSIYRRLIICDDHLRPVLSTEHQQVGRLLQPFCRLVMAAQRACDTFLDAT